MMVVPRAIVEAGQHAAALAGFDEVFHHIGGVTAPGDRVGGMAAGPEAVTGDVLGAHDGVFHARVARHADPLIHVEAVRRVERGGIVARGEFVAGAVLMPGWMNMP